MANNREEFVITLRDQFSSGMKKAQRNTDIARQKVDSLNSSLSKIKSLAVGAFGTAAIIRGVNSSISAFEKQEQAVAQVRQGILSTNQAAGRSLENLTKQARNFQKGTIFGDEEILQGVTAQLLTFTNIAGNQFDRTQQAALDLATRLGGDLQSASIQLGKALNDPISNLSALSRSGIQFSKQQKEVIKNLVETNRLADAQTIILDELSKQYGGSAAAAAQTASGRYKQLQNELGDVNERIGAAMLPLVSKLTKSFLNLIRFVERNRKVFIALGKVVLSVAAGYAAYRVALIAVSVAQRALRLFQTIRAFLQLARTVRTVKDAMILLNTVTKTSPIGLVAGLLGAAGAAFLSFRDDVSEANKELSVFDQLMVDTNDLLSKASGNFNKVSDLQTKNRAQLEILQSDVSSTIDNINKQIVELSGQENAITKDLQKLKKEAGSVGIDLATAPTQIDPSGGRALEQEKLLKEIGNQIKQREAKSDVQQSNKKLEDLRKSLKDQQKLLDDVNNELKTRPEDQRGLPGAGIGTTPGSASKIKGGISEVRAAAPKTFNININSLIERVDIKSETISEGTQELKQKLVETLLTGVNDIQVISTRQ